MVLDLLTLPSQAVVPLGVALGHLVLALYIIYRRRFRSFIFPHLFIGYLLLAIFWNLNLVVIVVDTIPFPLPGLSWVQLVPYGLMALGITYWIFARSFLKRSWRSVWAWGLVLIGLVSIGLSVGLDLNWLALPPTISAASSGWINSQNSTFFIGGLCWGIFMAATFLTTQLQLLATQNPGHKNRLKYLLLATIILSTGYGMYLTLLEPFWTTGLIVTWFGAALTGYLVVVENLINLGTGVRRLVSRLVVIMITIAVYIAGIYLVQIFLGDYLASTFLARFLSPVLLVAAVTAVFLTIVYTPIDNGSRRFIQRLLFGQNYDFQSVIQNYTQAISNILYLDELATVALDRIKQTLGIQEGVLFMFSASTADYFYFITLPLAVTHQYPENLTLTKDTPVVHRLMVNGEPLAQYTMDISPHFKNTPDLERQALEALNFEWFFPILKQSELIGIFGLGPKNSRQPYNMEDIRLLTTLSDQTALALENASLVDRLRRNLQQTTRMKNLMDNVFDSMENGVITTDLGGRITLFNKAAESILNLTDGDECIGKPYTEVLPSLTHTIFPNLVANVLKHKANYTDFEIISTLPGRGRVHLNVNLAPLRDAHNNTQGVTMVMDDLTETKRLQAVQDMFRRYVSPAVVDRLPSDASDLELGGHRQEITVLFADIRGFTTFSEKLEPENLVDILNEYLSMAATAILMNEGTLDKFTGDAVMGIFNAPLVQTDHIIRAARSAMAMQKAIADHHRNIGQERNLSFGVGLHVGEAVVGNIGMSDRMDYTAIGDTVNVAKRIQENTPGNKILVSEPVHHAVKDTINSVFYKEMKVKGRQEPVRTYELKQLEG